MTLRRKIIAWTMATILAIPAILVFNDNEETVAYNIGGLAYCFLLIKTARRILPSWMIEYFRK